VEQKGGVQNRTEQRVEKMAKRAYLEDNEEGKQRQYIIVTNALHQC
jgi:hypothetical protein